MSLGYIPHTLHSRVSGWHSRITAGEGNREASAVVVSPQCQHQLVPTRRLDDLDAVPRIVTSSRRITVLYCPFKARTCFLDYVFFPQVYCCVYWSTTYITVLTWILAVLAAGLDSWVIDFDETVRPQSDSCTTDTCELCEYVVK